ncbi:complex I NDUFA9 subunit family protein [Geomonas subterranea]|uniref:Complex I NDUFA9 subunit family protein n=1 Tax=Geomonas subterranea TaxID=2847989 RepID=A0ABX8LIJ2_9BACT|nr:MULTISPECIES: complex I NDUFA9 subunit family protein [Geomonas]QXE90479.1 complex I NDUFA9 subunit family protein [Geomonas subterranea]QXM11445.1 complex I NDUFA9 subunit family protein [Geomonas subterranea]
MLIFLAGGTGFVGGHVREALLARGHSLRLLVHRRSLGGIVPDVEEIVGDVTKPETFEEAVHGCDATINLVGIIREFPGRGVTFQRLHVEATANILAAAKKGEVRRHLQMSALGTSAGSTARYFKSKYQAEDLVRRSGQDYTIFRPSIIFGPKDEFINTLAGYMRSFPAMPVIGDGEYQLQPISAEDVARCFADALEKPETIGQEYDLCGPDRYSYNELLDIIGRVIGKSHVTKIKNPLSLMRLIVPFFEGFSFFPITSDQIAMLVQGSTCNGSWRTTFDFEPVNFESGIRSYLK